MTPEEEGLLDAIVSYPDDNAPRLIYADWLEDHGNAVRANFIRGQILHGLKELPVQESDCGCNGVRWVGEYAGKLTAWSWRDGFLDSVDCSIWDWGKSVMGQHLVAMHPLRHVNFHDCFPHAWVTEPIWAFRKSQMPRHIWNAILEIFPSGQFQSYEEAILTVEAIALDLARAAAAKERRKRRGHDRIRVE